MEIFHSFEWTSFEPRGIYKNQAIKPNVNPKYLGTEYNIIYSSLFSPIMRTGSILRLQIKLIFKKEQSNKSKIVFEIQIYWKIAAKISTFFFFRVSRLFFLQHVVKNLFTHCQEERDRHAHWIVYFRDYRARLNKHLVL